MYKQPQQTTTTLTIMQVEHQALPHPQQEGFPVAGRVESVEVQHQVRVAQVVCEGKMQIK